LFTLVVAYFDVRYELQAGFHLMDGQNRKLERRIPSKSSRFLSSQKPVDLLAALSSQRYQYRFDEREAK